MVSEQITTISIFQFKGFSNQFFALKSMAFLLPKIISTRGLKFAKLLGSGGGNGFAIYPNLGQYVFLGVWDNEALKNDFFNNNINFRAYCQKAHKVTTYSLVNTMSHGLWGGINPFTPDKNVTQDGKIAVITRATIKWWDMFRFWRQVPDSSKNMDQFPGCELAIGVGELPFRFQATFSIWSDAEKMRDFAYKSRQHTEMIAKTKKIGWYKEELFARFRVLY